MEAPKPFPPVDLTPEQFELAVKGMLDAAGPELAEYKSEHRPVLTGNDGNYEIDIAVRFSALGGANFLVLIECKRYQRRVEREQVQALWAKQQSLNAQKAIMFATAGFQSGAIEFAAARRVALVEIADARSSYLVKVAPKLPAPELEHDGDYGPPVVGWLLGHDSVTLVSAEKGFYVRDVLSLR